MKSTQTQQKTVGFENKAEFPEARDIIHTHAISGDLFLR